MLFIAFQLILLNLRYQHPLSNTEMPNYPDVKYWFLVEYLYLDIVGEKRVFQTLSNFNHVEGILKLST